MTPPAATGSGSLPSAWIPVNGVLAVFIAIGGDNSEGTDSWAKGDVWNGSTLGDFVLEAFELFQAILLKMKGFFGLSILGSMI